MTIVEDNGELPRAIDTDGEVPEGSQLPQLDDDNDENDDNDEIGDHQEEDKVDQEGEAVYG